ALRIACRAWRVASAVTAQVLITTAWRSPAAAACPRMTSVSKALRRQPKERSSVMPLRRRGAQGQLALEADRDGPGHAQMIVGHPFDLEAAAVEQELGA